jgi:glycosyltransferase involved in cell wall biosynthesis
VFVLASRSEVMPLVVLESLAAGTPVVMTRHHGMDTSGLRHVLTEVDPASHDQIASAAWAHRHHAARRAECADAVRHLSWDAVARQLMDVYEDVLRARGALH